MDSVIVYEIKLTDAEEIKIIVNMKNNFDDRYGFVWVDLP